MGESTVRRTCYFGALWLLSLLFFWKPLMLLVPFSFQHVHLSHIFFIPFLSIFFLWRERKEVFARVHYSFLTGLCLLLLAMMLYGAVSQISSHLGPHDYLSATTFALVLTWVGLFVIFYGSRSFRAGIFPLLFLFLMVPPPEFLLAEIISVLQKGSATVAEGLFGLVGIPTFREGFQFTLPGLTIEVAEECSGIRSSIALLVTGLLAGHLYLQSAWGKLSLTFSIIPLAMLKNALRIVVITLLGMYVDPGYLTGALHRRGGIVFFLVSVGLLAIELRVLQRFEKRNMKYERFPWQHGTKAGEANGRRAQALSGQ